jgi:hypothetical protein
LIEVARAHEQQGDRASTLTVLDRAERTAPETVQFNGRAKQMTHALLDQPPAGESAAVRDLAGRIGIP